MGNRRRIELWGRIVLRVYRVKGGWFEPRCYSIPEHDEKREEYYLATHPDEAVRMFEREWLFSKHGGHVVEVQELCAIDAVAHTTDTHSALMSLMEKHYSELEAS